MEILAKYRIPDVKVSFVSVDQEVKAVVCLVDKEYKFKSLISTFHSLDEAVRYSQKNRFMGCLWACTVYKYVCDTKGE